jgi:hypothetical protein
MTPRRIDWWRVIGCLATGVAFWAFVWLLLIVLPGPW